MHQLAWKEGMPTAPSMTLRSQFMCILLCSCLLQLSSPAAYPESDVEDVEVSERYQQGKRKYEAIKRDSEMPKYSACWTEALSLLEAGCKQLTDDIQYRLALAFTNCHLQRTGQGVYPCESTQPISECVKDMDTKAYLTHTEFVTHTQNICFFLQSQIWHEATEYTISRLADNSALVAQQMEDSSHLQSDILSKQTDSIRNQEVLLERGVELKTTLEESSLDVHKMLQEFKDTTSEQRALIFEVFDKVSALQSVVMGEFTGFYSMIFYTVSILICYLLTSTPRTASARFWLFALMTVNVLTERLIVMFGATDNVISEGHILESSTIIYGRLWWCRKVFSAFAICLWLWFAYNYRDINKVNHRLLMDIQQQNSELKHLLQTTPSSGILNASSASHHGAINGFAGHGQIGFTPLAPVSGQIMPACPSPITSHGERSDVVDSCYPDSIGNNTTEGYESGSESDSDDSVRTEMTDRTWRAADDSESDTSYMTIDSGRFSREGTPALLDELKFLRDSTPMKEMTPFESYSNTDQSFASPEAPQTSTPRRAGRPPGSRNRTQPPQNQRVYNLRRRGYQDRERVNPVVNHETPEDFARTVKHLANIAMRNQVKAHYTVERIRQEGNNEAFSSDDD